METHKITSIAALRDFAKKIIQQAATGDTTHAVVFGLTGDLGAGKTAFTKVVGEVLGITEPITSPTFVIQKTYTTADDVFKTLVHIDAYRFDDGVASEELQKLGWDETLAQPNTLIIVEWADRITDILPEHASVLDFSIESDGETRQVTVTTSESNGNVLA